MTTIPTREEAAEFAAGKKMSEQFDLGYIAGLGGMTLSARKFFRAMPEAEWNAWQPRYRALLDICDGKQRFLTPLTWWEQDFLAAMMSHPGMTDSLRKQ
jgi:hypothetical protein